MANLTLAPTKRLFGIGDKNDYVVLDDGWSDEFSSLASAGGEPWFWTITSMEKPPSVYNKGYSATLEQAMADFKKQWFNWYQSQRPTDGPGLETVGRRSHSPRPPWAWVRI